MSGAEDTVWQSYYQEVMIEMYIDAYVYHRRIKERQTDKLKVGAMSVGSRSRVGENAVAKLVGC